MQLFYLLIFIGATQCDDSSDDNDSISPDCYDNLGVPNAEEYVSQYKLSVQTAYITSVECMRSSNNYMQSGFPEIDSSSNDLEANLITKFKDGFSSTKNMILGLQQTDEEKESQDKINAVVYMTVNHYQKQNVIVKKSETKLSEVTEVHQAHSILTAQSCESSYIAFINDVTTIQEMYASGTSETSDADDISTNQWATLVNDYYDARDNIITNKTNVYTLIREAFLLGSGINLCEGSANNDQSLLKIYETDDLSTFFAQTDNNASALLCKTVTQMYTIYKASLTNIYLKSVVHSYSDLALRVTIWEQVNLVRANFEYMSQNIEMFIKTTQLDAESSFGADSSEYNTIMIALYTCVNEMLLTVVKTTKVHYERGLNFNPDRSMIKTDYNQYKIDKIENYYENVVWSIPNAAEYDMRIVDKEECSYPSSKICIPQNMYSLVINKLVFETFICQLNYMDERMKTAQYDKKNVDSWIYERVSIVQLQNSIIFSKCTATVNKIFIINSATYTYVLLTTDQSTQSTDIQQIIDQSTADVVGTLCVNTLEITDTFYTVELFVNKYCNTNTTSVVYRPNQPRNSNMPPPNSRSPPSNNGNYPNSGNYSPNSGSPPSNNGSPPSNNGSPPSNNGSPPPNNGSPPPNNGSPPSNNGNYPNSGNYSPNSGSPPSNNGSPPPNNGSPPTNNGSPPSNNGSPPPNNGSPPSNNGSPPSNNGSPPPNNGSPPPNNGSPPSNNGSPPPNNGSPPTNNGSPPSNNGSPPPNNGSPPSNNGNYPNSGNYSPNSGSPPSNNGSPPSNNGSPPPNNGSPPPKSGNYPPNSGSYSPNSGSPSLNNYSQSGSSTNNNQNNGNSLYNQYSYVTSATPITKAIQILRSSSENKMTTCLTNVQNITVTEYTKVVIKSLKICQQITQYNVDYLDTVTSDSIKYVSEVTTTGSQDYFFALIVILRDTQEKSKILYSTMDIPFRRTTNQDLLTSEKYVYVPQTIVYKEFIDKFYKYFKVNCEKIYNSENDADLYLTNSTAQFNKIYETVVKAVKGTQDDSYKTFLLSYLEKTIAVYKQTADCFKELIVQSQQFISQSGDDSKKAFYEEITQRFDSIIVMYSGVLIKSYQYSKDTSSVTLFVSEFDVITMQTEIVSSYTNFNYHQQFQMQVKFN